MRFALIGQHPDGLAVARALATSGRHELLSYSGPKAGAEALRAAGVEPKEVVDFEEVLADPAVEAVIVAGRAGSRPAQLRRAAQSELHVLCVHPADASTEVAHEASMIAADSKHLLFPLVYEALHPAIGRLAALLQNPESPLGTLRLLLIERSSPAEVLLDVSEEGHKPGLPGWDVLRALGGEILEVSAFAAGETAGVGDAVLLAGRFEQGGLFRSTLLPHAQVTLDRIVVLGSLGTAELSFVEGWTGLAHLSVQRHGEATHKEELPAWDPWPEVVKAFESALTEKPPGTVPTWHDELRLLELDDAARRSIERRRVSAMDYVEGGEEVNFKGTMTLVGCGLLWSILLVLILARWVPWLGWLIAPVLFAFLALQLLRWVIPGPPAGKSP